MSIRVEGADKLLKKLSKLEKKDAKAAQRKAARAAGIAMRNVVKPFVPRDEGVLKKATTYKTYWRGGYASAIVGANTRMLAEKESPTNQDQLVEYGHVAPDGTFVPPSGYFRRAAAGATDAGQLVYIEVLRKGIEEAL